MLTLTDVTAAYGKVEVLHGVSLEVAAGEVLALLGRNGAGKTTTLRAIMGLIDRRGGQVRVGEQGLEGVPAHRIAAHGVAYVPQGRRLFPSLSVAENLRIGLLANPDAAPSVLADVLELFPALRDKLDSPARSLSGGQQQMVAMGRALCTGPRVLLLDEPTEGLQPTIVKRILETIGGLKTAGVAVLLVEQKVNAALEVADRVAFIENGRVPEQLETRHLLEAPETLQRYLGVGQSR